MSSTSNDYIQPEEAESEARDPSNIVPYKHFVATETPRANGLHKLKMPTLNQLLSATFKQRKYLLAPWLREQENCMVYAATGVGKSLFAMSAALAVASLAVVPALNGRESRNRSASDNRFR